jgi:hypothetical protein
MVILSISSPIDMGARTWRAGAGGFGIGLDFA